MDTDKKEFLKTLKNTVVVLGNGFDLHCGLHTSYGDYFKTVYKKHLNICFWFGLFENNHFFQVNDYHAKIIEYSIWDIFFALNIKTNKEGTSKNWCDVEKLMLSSFISYDDLKKHSDWNYLKLSSVIDWNQIKDSYVNGTPCSSKENQFVSEIFRYKAELNNRPDFYGFLLEELKHFEAGFGRFIERQIKSDYLEKSTKFYPFHKSFFTNAISTIDEISSTNNLSRIDTFNYSYFMNDETPLEIHHINGDVKSPIFGIDSIYFESSDPRFIFTKTCRRMDADIREKRIDKPVLIQNIVIYGHSLDDADFNYFFPLFDKIGLTDPQSTGIVVYAFTVHDKNRDAEIRKETRERITHLFSEYAKSKNGTVNPERFLDSLTTQGKVLVTEIQPISKPKDPIFDDEWDEIEKLFNLLKDNKNAAYF